MRSGQCPCGKTTNETQSKKGSVGYFCAGCFSSYIYDCKGSFHSSSFQFHHLDPKSKEFEWTKMRSKSADKVFAELKKTILLCANCHSKRHSGGPNWINLDKEKERFLKKLKELRAHDV